MSTVKICKECKWYEYWPMQQVGLQLMDGTPVCNNPKFVDKITGFSNLNIRRLRLPLIGGCGHNGKYFEEKTGP